MEHRCKRAVRLAGVFVALCLPLAALAQTPGGTQIYKWIDRDGVVSYSQTKPTEAGAHDISTITIEGLPPERARAARRTLANLEKLSDAETAARQARLAAADQRIAQALQRLQQTEHNLSAGSDPTGYDRVGNVGGHARLRDSYFERVASLQAAVDSAKQALNDAYAARDQAGE